MGIRRFVRKRLLSRLSDEMRILVERIYYYPYVRREVKIFKHLCDPNKVALDVGANKGDVSLYLSKLASHVCSFEPIKHLCDSMQSRFKGSNVSIYNCALGNNQGEMYINIPCIGTRQIDSRSSLIKDFTVESIKGNAITKVEKEKIRIERLDDLAIKNIGFIKIDVEGFEFEVMKGGANTIKTEMPNLYIEIEQRHHEHENIIAVINAICAFGYEGFFYCNNVLRSVKEFNPEEMQQIAHEKSDRYINNFIFIPEKASSNRGNNPLPFKKKHNNI